MAWDFSTEPEFQAHLDWMTEFVREEIWPMETLDLDLEQIERAMAPLQEQVKERGLWAAHLDPELGGQGYGQVHLAYLNEILGRSAFAPSVVGCQAPDSGNAEILAHYGTPAQRLEFLEPLVDGRVSSCYSMTEPQGGSDPSLFTGDRGR
jgi:acyl-CoA dehydrogenase